MGQMPELDDHRLLAEFVRGRSETAFTELVRRYAGLVHSTAFRFCGNPHHAEEITQAVFVILARKAGTLSPRVVVSGWLYQTARLTAANFVRGEMRRRRREQEAVMQSNLLETDPTAWEKIAPLLDDAMGALGETDRNAVLLRYFENRTSSEIGVALRMNGETARKRVNRALEKLRHFFVKRGVAVSSAALSGAISANSVQPISAFMVKSISAVALAKGAAAPISTLTLIKGALKIMAWSKVKTAIVASAVVMVAAGTATVVVKKVTHPAEPSWANDPRIWHGDLTALRKLPEVSLLRPTKFSGEQSRTLDGFGTTVDGCIKDAVVNLDIRELLKFAYGMRAGSARVLFPEDLPRGHFDFLFTMPRDANEILRNELKSRFGLAAHREEREMDALSLRLTDLKSWERNNSQKKDHTPRMPGEATNSTIDDLIPFLESKMGKPVVNQTGLAGRYNTDFKWNTASGETEKENIKQALFDQLGLELVSTNLPIEMLVVEKAK